MRAALLAGTAWLGSMVQPALSLADGALPTGGSVVSGNASIASPSASSLRIDQSSPTAILNWDSFSIGAGNSVTFANGSGATLNRVTGLSASQIDGLLSASGSVYLVNPSGIVVGSSGIISTGGSFIASTLDVSDEEFNAQGAMTFKGGSQAAVINYGAIGSLGGDVALIARRAVNEGSIDAPNGTAALAAGYEVLMRDQALSDGKFLVKVGGGDTEASTSGAIRAANVELRANGGNVYALAGNTGGVTKATGVASKDGRIFLTAGDGGTVNVTQKLSAKRITGKGKAAGGDIRISGGDVMIAAMFDAAGEADAGGTIVATGAGVSILSTAKLDVSGALGGVILVGGDYQGGANADTKYLAEAVANAKTTTVESGAILDASGSEGAGGNVVVWSDKYTDFGGSIVATGSGSGAGGDAEVSGKAVLDFTGTVNLTSASGAFGWLLLDPYNLTISNSASSGMSGFNANADDSVLNAGALVAALNGANVKVTTGSGGSQAGDITVDAVISWNSSSTLELSAYHDIVVNWNISSPGGGALVLRADNTGTGAGTVSFGTGTHLFTYGGATIYYNPSSYANPTDYSGDMGGGVPLTAYMLVNNVDQLQAINSNLDANYALGRDIDASATATWNGGAGFAPIGTTLGTSLTGIFDGQGHVIDGLTIDNSGIQFVGLFGYTNSNTVIRNVGVTNVDIVGSSAYSVGAVVGYNAGTLTDVYASGSVQGEGSTGGLVGTNDHEGMISDSYSMANVTSVSAGAGGLVGLNSGTITTSYASGAVSGSGMAGGITTLNNGSISNSYWDIDSTGQGAAFAGDGDGTAVNVVGIDASNRYKQSTYASLDFTHDWYMIDGETRPFLRSEYQTTITNAHQLQLIALDLGATYTLGADVDASATDGSDAAGMWSTRGFVPLGTDSQGEAVNSNNGFYGTLDGQGHVIDRLTIDRPDSENVGLFGRAGNATILDLGLTNIDVTGMRTIGGLVGFAKADGGDLTVARTYVTGTLDTYFGEAGGFFGEVYARLGTVKIEQSYADVDIKAGGFAGGLVGFTYATSGGTVSIADSYAVGSVDGGIYIGGLVGSILYGSVKIERSYAANQVTSFNTVGGLVGSDTGATSYSGNFWDTDATGQSCGVGTACAGVAGVTGLTTAQFQDTASFMTLASAAGWDFDTAWAPPSAGYYPELYAMTPVVWVKSATASSTYGDSTATVTSTSGAGGPSSYVFGPAGDSLDPLGTSIAVDPTLSAGDQLVTLANGNSSQTSTGGVTYRVFTYNAGSTVSVDKATLTVTADNGQIDYGDTPSALGYSVSGWKNNQTDTLLAGVAVSTGATALSDVGGYLTTATGGVLLGDATGNYTITYVNGGFEVTPATLTVTADNGQSIYGDTPGAIGYSVAGWKNSQTDALLTGVDVSTGATALSNVGTGYITTANGGALGGAATGNYTITYVNGSFEVKPATLTVTADNGQAIYGDAPGAIDYSVSGWKNSQTDALLTGVNVATDANALSNVSTSYITTASGGTLGGAATGNYTFSYVNGSFEVKPATLTVTADNGQAIYGDAPGALGYSVAGWKNSQTDALLTGVGVSTDATSLSNVGNGYITAATGGALGGAATGNYVISYVDGGFEVMQRSLTVTADAQTMIYSNAVPGLTYQIGGLGLVNGDQLSGGLATSGSSTSNVGGYGITQGSLAASSNYALTYVGNQLSITQRPLTITADAQSMIYGNAVPGLTYQIGGLGLVNGDQLSGGLTTAGSSTADVGFYAIALGSLAASSNYAVTYVGNQLTITQRPLTITADDQSRGVRVANPALTYEIGGLGLVNGDALTGGLATDATLTSQPGAYSILQGSLAASGNYAVTYEPGTLLVTAALPPGEWLPVFEPPIDDWREALLSAKFLALTAGGNAQTGETEAPCPGGAESGNCPILPLPENLPQSPWLRFAAH
ncbi:MBG domain-containing protein [Kaistia algarum]|uniref:MBG domain-containing protein n=1 Tax=Kaistia algarum TaxID=2083279 RepID=UPI001401F92B|nr:MBG domain-containing protein [Kaistia algarum]MCX5512829.1 MBG domain-containing protein [Kaistia algarum]